MNERVSWTLARARNELEAARLLARGGFREQAVSRAYFAAFHAAEACLLALGESRSKHAGVIAAFMQRIVKPGGFDPDVARSLRSLFDRRNEADYANPAVSEEVASSTIGMAERFVAESERWLKERG